MSTFHFSITSNLEDPSSFVLKTSKNVNQQLADNLFRKKLYETPKNEIPALIDFHYRNADEPTEFIDYTIELLEVALDESENVKFLKSLSFWGDPESNR